MAGRMADALQSIQQHFPHLLSDTHLMFAVYGQWFVEEVRAMSDVKAMELITRHLVPLTHIDPSLEVHLNVIFS